MTIRKVLHKHTFVQPT